MDKNDKIITIIWFLALICVILIFGSGCSYKLVSESELKLIKQSEFANGKNTCYEVTEPKEPVIVKIKECPKPPEFFTPELPFSDITENTSAADAVRACVVSVHILKSYSTQLETIINGYK